VPAASLDLLEALRPVRPGRQALAVSQDRLSEKAFLSGLGLRVAPFAPVSDAGDAGPGAGRGSARRRS
jgi:5-(carboxyamino)imidazole ribonucleotide synthase